MESKCRMIRTLERKESNGKQDKTEAVRKLTIYLLYRETIDAGNKSTYMPVKHHILCTYICIYLINKLQLHHHTLN